MSASGIKIFAPGCISMHYFGLEDMSLAIDNPGNEILAHIENESNSVRISGFSKEKEDTQGTKSIVENIANDFLTHINISKGVKLDFFNRIPFEAGLGNIEANITAALVAINDLLKSRLEKKEIFNFIAGRKDQYDRKIILSNVAANLFGGIILYTKNIENPIQKIYNPHGISFSIILIKRKSGFDYFNKINTGKIIHQATNIALLIKGLMTSDLDLISGALKNNELENIIAGDDKLYEELKSISYQNGAYSTGFTHLGESIVIINPNTAIAEKNNAAIEKFINSKGIKYKILNAKLNLNGIYKF